MSYSITSPIEGFQGTSEVGRLLLNFTDGVAQIAEKPNKAELAYLRSVGYKIGSADGEKVVVDPDLPKDSPKDDGDGDSDNPADFPTTRAADAVEDDTVAEAPKRRKK